MFYFLLGIYFFYVAAKAILAILQINFIRAEDKKPAGVLDVYKRQLLRLVA